MVLQMQKTGRHNATQVCKNLVWLVVAVTVKAMMLTVPPLSKTD